MSYEVKCIFCEKTWQSKDPDFLTVCGCCKKTASAHFESQFMPKLLKAGVLKHIRVEEK